MQAIHEITILSRLADDIRVVSFRGREEISGLYHFDIDVSLPPQATGVEADAMDRSVCLTLHAGDAPPRMIHGIVASAQATGARLHDRPIVRLRVVPRAWRLKRRTTSRIFQDQSVVEVAMRLLAERGLGARLRITGDYPLRDYCVQYQESDYAFLSRILAAAGLFFYFDHPTAAGDDNATSMGTAEVFVLSDTAEYYPPLDGGERLVFRRPRWMVP